MPLTDTAIRQAKPTEKTRKLADAQGLYLELSPAGGKWWRLKYRFEGKEKRLSLGTYPETSLAVARGKRDAARALLRTGVDPSAERKEEKRRTAVAADNSFEAIAREWHKAWSVTRTPKHAGQVMQRLEGDIFPAIGALPVAKITAPMLLALAKKVEARGANDLARRAFQVAGQVLRYAVAHGLATQNVAAQVKPGDALKPKQERHFARLDAREMPELLNKIEVYAGYPRTRLALKLMTLTFLRTTELIQAQWSEIDVPAKLWRVPAGRMKMRTDHLVPLSRQALRVIEEIRESGTGPVYLFPGERDHEACMSNNTILFALYRMGYRGRMTGHGFRGVASTILHELGHRHDLIELQLAHQERDKISAAYNFATYLPQRAEMMQAWADHVDSMRAQLDPK